MIYLTTKLAFFPLHLTDWPQMEATFARQAREGWLIQKLWAGFAVYQRIEPAEFDFSVAVYPEAKVFEGFDKSKIKKFARQEAENGWQLATTRHNLQVFYRPVHEAGPALRRPFQLGNMASQLKLETVSFSLLLALNLFQLRGFMPLNHHQLYRNISLMLILWLPFLFLFFISRLALNGWTLYKVKKGLTVENFPRDRSFANRFLNGISAFSMGIVIFFLLITILMESLSSGGRFLLFMLPVLLATGLGFGLRKHFVGKNLDPALKTLAMIAGVVAVVFATSHVSLSLADGQSDEPLPADRLALTLHDLEGSQAATYTSYRESGSVLVPLHYRYYESAGSFHNVSTTVATARNTDLAHWIFNKQQEELLGFNHQLKPADENYPEFEEVVTAIPSFRPSDGSGGGVLLVRDDRHVVSLSVSWNLQDPDIQAFLRHTLYGILAELD